MKLTSPAFKPNGMIPEEYTCDSKDISPALNIEDIPENTKSLALVVDDPDAPGRTFVHWVVYDMPVVSEIKKDDIPGKQGLNDFDKKDYGGPCPPNGKHRYFFKAYALDEKLDLEEGATKNELQSAMEGHILDSAELIGLYER